MTPDLDPTRAVFGITVAAEMVGLDPQSLRLYERRGLVSPQRTPGGTRRYSFDDIDLLQRITALLDAGVNLAGIGMVLQLQDENTQLQRREGPVR